MLECWPRTSKLGGSTCRAIYAILSSSLTQCWNAQVKYFYQKLFVHILVLPCIIKSNCVYMGGYIDVFCFRHWCTTKMSKQTCTIQTRPRNRKPKRRYYRISVHICSSKYLLYIDLWWWLLLLFQYVESDIFNVGSICSNPARRDEKKCCLLESKWKIKYDLLHVWRLVYIYKFTLCNISTLYTCAAYMHVTVILLAHLDEYKHELTGRLIGKTTYACWCWRALNDQKDMDYR